MRNIGNKNRIVVKVGTSTLTHENGRMNFNRIDHLARAISDLSNEGKQIVLVTSGAISVGTGRLNLKARPSAIRDKQAVAAVGQSELMHIYSKYFSEYGYIVGQILLTREDVAGEQRRKNIENTFEALLEKGIIPIVNENDSVSIDEIMAGELHTFSENDTLSAIVASIIKADLLIILSDIDGFYDKNPKENKKAKRFEVIYDITDEIEACAGNAGTNRGTGGMATKINAARIATEAGVDMIIANGDDHDILRKILSGEEVGTLFCARR